MRSFILLTLLLISIKDLLALDQELRDYFLNAHNDYRSKLALGTIKNKNGTLLPSASNMYELSYSLDVEKIAQDWADNCDIKHAIINHTTNNLFAEHPFKDFDSASKRGMDAWLYELEDNGLPSLNFVNESNVGHWVEINWHNVLEIGCGITNCSTVKDASPSDRWTFLVCAYNPGGNYLTELIYKPGKPCSDCSSYANSRCDENTGLCYIDDGRHRTTKSSTHSTNPSTKHSTSASTHLTRNKSTKLSTSHSTKLSKTLNPHIMATTSEGSKVIIV